MRKHANESTQSSIPFLVLDALLTAATTTAVAAAAVIIEPTWDQIDSSISSSNRTQAKVDLYPRGMMVKQSKQ